MADSTPRLNLYKPADDGSEPVNVATDLNDNWEKIDSVIGAVPATSTTPPSSTFNGMLRQNTDTGTLEYLKNGITWTQIWNKGASFAGHALLTLGNRIGIGTVAPGAVLDAIVGSGSELLARLRVGNEVNPRLQIDSDGIRIGAGGAATPDVRMYRAAANTLNITGKVVVENDLLVNGTPSFAGGFSVTDATNFDGDVNLNGGADIQDHLKYNGYSILCGFTNAVSMPAVSNASSAQATVTFPYAFSGFPNVFTNFTGGAGATAQWSSRALSVTPTGFTAFITGPVSTFSSVTVQWVALQTT